MSIGTSQPLSPIERARLRVVYALGGAVFFMPLNLFIMEGCLVLALFLGAYYYRAFDAPDFPSVPLLKPALCFAGTALLSLIGSPETLLGLAFYAFTVLQYICFYVLVIYFIRNEGERRLLLFLFLLSAACVGVYGLYQYVHMLTLHEAAWVDNTAFPLLKRRMYSTLYNPNLLSAFLLMVMGTAAAMTVWTRHKWHRITYASLFALMTLCLVLTYSRGAWLSVCALVVFFGFIWDKRIWLCLLAVPLILAFYHGGVTERLLSIFSHSEADTSVSMRLDMWYSAIAMIASHPLFGIGWGAFKYVYPWYNELIREAGITIFHAHNMFLNILAETGFAGFLSYMAFFFGNAWYSIRFLRRGLGNHFDKAIATATAAAVISVSVTGISDYDLFSTQISLIFWFICALFANSSIPYRNCIKKSLRNNSQ